MCYNSEFSLPEDESSYNEGEVVHSFIAPEEEAALKRVVTSEAIACGSSSVSVDGLFFWLIIKQPL